MQSNEILLPKPVSITTPAIRKAITTSHVVESPNPFNASFNEINPTNTENNNPVKTLTAIGTARIKMEIMTDINTIKI